jgi:hypothetical protein
VRQESASGLRRRLAKVGLSPAAIRAAWPRWWSDDAETSVSARADLRFALARYLGLDPRTLLDADQQPTFLWSDHARFKRLTAKSDVQRDSIASFGHALATLLLAATAAGIPITGTSAADLRQLILTGDTAYVRLVDLLSLCWSAGIPVIHMRVFPGRHKHLAAMTVRLADRYAIMLAKDSMYPAPIAFYLAHELGHISSGHLAREAVIVDLETGSVSGDGDAEEAAADAFGLDLLTGSPRPTVLPQHGGYSARSLAKAALASGEELGIEPGVLAMCFGYSTNDWRTANAAHGYIYASKRPAWREVNEVAASQLELGDIPSDGRAYLETVMGLGT